MHPRTPGWTRLLLVVALAAQLSACTGGCATADDLAFCDAVERNDPAAAQALLAAGRVNVLGRNFSGKCQPVMQVFHAATPTSPAFTAMAIGLLKQEGVANTYWTRPVSNNISGDGGASERPLQVAINHGNAPLVRALLAAGADVNAAGARNAVLTAVGADQLEIIRILVEGGVDPTFPLTFAIDNRHPAIVDYLESKGGREDVDPLLVAARRGDLKAIDAAVARRANLEVEDGQRRTPVMRAAYYGHADAITRLAKAGASLAHASEGHTALHLAANENHAEAVRALAAAGANLNARAGADSPTPLLAAIANGSTAAVSALVDAGADTNVAIASDLSAMSKALALGNLAMVRALVRGGARVNERIGAGWQPPIHWTLGICGLPPEGGTENDYYRVTLLKTIVAAGASATVKNKDGRTPVESVLEQVTGDQPFYRACREAKLAYLRSVQ
jgi:ankyrin repeat protein